MPDPIKRSPDHDPIDDRSVPDAGSLLRVAADPESPVRGLSDVAPPRRRSPDMPDPATLARLGLKQSALAEPKAPDVTQAVPPAVPPAPEHDQPTARHAPQQRTPREAPDRGAASARRADPVAVPQQALGAGEAFRSGEPSETTPARGAGEAADLRATMGPLGMSKADESAPAPQAPKPNARRLRYRSHAAPEGGSELRGDARLSGPAFAAPQPDPTKQPQLHAPSTSSAPAAEDAGLIGAPTLSQTKPRFDPEACSAAVAPSRHPHGANQQPPQAAHDAVASEPDRLRGPKVPGAPQAAAPSAGVTEPADERVGHGADPISAARHLADRSHDRSPVSPEVAPPAAKRPDASGTDAPGPQHNRRDEGQPCAHRPAELEPKPGTPHAAPLQLEARSAVSGAMAAFVPGLRATGPETPSRRRNDEPPAAEPLAADPFAPKPVDAASRPATAATPSETERAPASAPSLDTQPSAATATPITSDPQAASLSDASATAIPAAGDQAPDAKDTPPVPATFGFENEHPRLNIPFTLHFAGRRLTGTTVSVTHLTLAPDGSGALTEGMRDVGSLVLAFQGFQVVLEPELIVQTPECGAEGAVLAFSNPTGPHLPQLRYVLNSYIAGDTVSLNGMLSYKGPDKPRDTSKASKGAEAKRRRHSAGMLALSGVLFAITGAIVYARYTTGHEAHPVFVDLAGQPMRATVSGQVSYLNPEAGEGEVLYAIDGTSGDVLNFRMPCDCGISVPPGIAEGTTVLPEDIVATVVDDSAAMRIDFMMSGDGLARAMAGAAVWLDLPDGRSLRVDVIPGSATRSAARAGQVFLPVELRPRDDTLGPADAGLAGRVRITPDIPARLGFDRKGQA